MKIEEAIRYFERELGKAEEAETYEASKADPDEELLHAWCYEREALRLALKALREKQASASNAEIITQLRRVAIDRHCCLGCGHEHNCGIHGCAIIRAAIGRLERRSEEETK